MWQGMYFLLPIWFSTWVRIFAFYVFIYSCTIYLKNLVFLMKEIVKNIFFLNPLLILHTCMYLGFTLMIKCRYIILYSIFNIFIFLRWCRGKAPLNTQYLLVFILIWLKVGSGGLKTRFSLPTLQHAGYRVKLKILKILTLTVGVVSDKNSL